MTVKVRTLTAEQAVALRDEELAEHGWTWEQVQRSMRECGCCSSLGWEAATIVKDYRWLMGL